MFNTYGKTTKTYGGSLPVWLEVLGRVTGGGTLRTIPAVGTIIPSATPVVIDKAGGTVDVLEFYSIVEIAAADATAIKIQIGMGLPMPAANEIIMKVPATLAGTGTAVTISSVVDNGDNTATLTISAALGALAVGDILTIAAASGASKAMKFTSLSGLSLNDVHIEEGTASATCAIVYSGKVMADRIQPIPDIFKALVPTINFEKGL